MSRDEANLRHIGDAIARIERYTGGLDRDGLARQEVTVDAVLRQLAVIGEAAGRVSPACISAHPELPFWEMIGMRNRLMHDHFGVDLDLVWQTCREELPGVRAAVEAVLEAGGLETA